MNFDTIAISSPLGPLQLVARGDELCGIYLPDQDAPAARTHASRVLDRAATQLAEYFAGTRREFDLPATPVIFNRGSAAGPHGTKFQQLVWAQLVRIPFGETRSYGELARAIGRPAASRAVGAANGKNPLAIVVPCHRVIGASGALTGYAGGMAAKRWLLDHERAAGCGLRASA